MRVTPDDIRTRFSTALSVMYRAEVPLYGDLLRIVAGINARTDDPERDAPRVELERHGAIRLGRPEELRLIRRLFAVMGMMPVGYYDLAPSGVPVHATAFRPIAEASLAANPFRMFTPLPGRARLAAAAWPRYAARIIVERRIMTPRAIALIEMAEADGLDSARADELVREALHTFRWNAAASVSRATYERLRAAHPLIADVVCFQRPHVNHLTPRTFDIDAVHAVMRGTGMDPKDSIEGPPRRAVPILLRQTSFKAREEPISFAGEPGTHTARFGEVEQRGAALTPKGRALYDEAIASGAHDALAAFPDDLEVLRGQGLIFCRASGAGFEPITYEDFLPVSAAGIFRSNLAGHGSAAVSRRAGDRLAFETALEGEVACAMSLYADLERHSVVTGSDGWSTPARARTSH